MTQNADILRTLQYGRACIIRMKDGTGVCGILASITTFPVLGLVIDASSGRWTLPVVDIESIG